VGTQPPSPRLLVPLLESGRQQPNASM